MRTIRTLALGATLVATGLATAQHVIDPQDAAALLMACEARQVLENPGLALPCPPTVLPALYEANDHMGWSMDLGHWNDDGLLDLAVGGVKHVNNNTGTTRVFIYLGDDSGSFDEAFKEEPALILAGTNDRDQFGFDVRFLPDVDGDDLDELVVGAPNYPNTPDGGGGRDRWGRVYLFLSDSLAVTSPPTVYDAASCAAAILEPPTGSSQGVRFGDVVEVVDDFDGVTGADLFIGAPGSPDVAAGYRGLVHVLPDQGWAGVTFNTSGCSGTPGLASTSNGSVFPYPPLRGGAGGDRFGESITALQDLDADGRQDVLVGATQFPQFELIQQLQPPVASDPGYVQAFRFDTGLAQAVPMASSVLASPTTLAPFGAFGYDAASVDLDGDGVDELAVGEPAWSDGADLRIGRVFLYEMSWSAGSGLSFTQTHELRGDNGLGLYGWELQETEDLFPGDGLSGEQLLIGAPYDHVQSAGAIPSGAGNEPLECTDPAYDVSVATSGPEPQGGPQSGSLFVVELRPSLDGGTPVVAHERLRLIGERSKDHMGGGFITGRLGDAFLPGDAPDLVCSGFAWSHPDCGDDPNDPDDLFYAELGRVYVFPGDDTAVTAAPEGLGHALGDGVEVPRLMAAGSLVPNSSVVLVCDRFASYATAPDCGLPSDPNRVLTMVLNLTTAYAPFQGGVIIPTPDPIALTVLHSCTLGTEGRFQIVLPLGPAPIAPGTPLFVQFWLRDGPSAPYTWSSTNGVGWIAP